MLCEAPRPPRLWVKNRPSPLPLVARDIGGLFFKNVEQASRSPFMQARRSRHLKPTQIRGTALPSVEKISLSNPWNISQKRPRSLLALHSLWRRMGGTFYHPRATLPIQPASKQWKFLNHETHQIYESFQPLEYSLAAEKIVLLSIVLSNLPKTTQIPACPASCPP